MAAFRQAATSRLRLRMKILLAGLLYRNYPITLEPLALNCWINEVIEAADVEGSVVEIGVNVGGTSVFTKKVMNELHMDKQYYAYDTFSGFVEKQLDADIKKGTDSGVRGSFTANSEALVRKIFAMHGVSDIITVKGDIQEQEWFPETISACLLDVDLSEPTYIALTKVYPRLSKRGVIVVDDCYGEAAMESGSWRANEGVMRYVQESGVPVDYKHGLALIRKPGE